MVLLNEGVRLRSTDRREEFPRRGLSNQGEFVYPIWLADPGPREPSSAQPLGKEDITGQERQEQGNRMLRYVAVVGGMKSRQEGDPKKNMQQETTAPYRERGVWGVCAWLLTGVGAVSLTGLGFLVYVAASNGQFPGELSASVWVQSWRTSWLDAIMKTISAPGFRMVSWPMVAIASAFFYVRRRHKESFLVLAATLMTGSVNVVIKHLIDRPRPPSDLVYAFEEHGGTSFPSGHVMHYVVFFGTLVLVSTQNMKPGIARSLICTGLVLWLMAIGVSRIYLGAHWVGDVLGGYAFGAVMLVVVVGLWRYQRR